MATKFALQARNIVRLARKFKFKLTRGSTGNVIERTACARGIVALAVKGNAEAYSIKGPDIGRTVDDLRAFEAGFEGWNQNDRPICNWYDYPNYSDQPPIGKLMKNRYYKVGQRVAKLAGY